VPETSPQPAAPVAVRDAVPADENFVLKTALLTLRNSSHLSWHVDNHDFFEGEQRLLRRILERSRVLVAHPVDDSELIAGFLVFESPDLAHFLYVKASLRRQGVASALLRAARLDPAQGFVATAATYDVTKGWIHKKYPAIRFNPYPRWE
jgi:GNAT superfamily N-acetyltransferase